MTKRGKFIMLCGLPGSGKSSYAEGIEGGKIVSTDKIRESLFGSEVDQRETKLVFDEAFKLSNELLNQGHTVVFDATNINRKKRVHAINHLIHADSYEIHYMDTPITLSNKRNSERERVVPSDVMRRMYHTMQLPVKGEGWDVVKYIHQPERGDLGTDDEVMAEMLSDIRSKGFKSIMEGEETYNHAVLFSMLSRFVPEFADIHNLPHDSSYHTLTVSEHTHKVYSLTKEIINSNIDYKIDNRDNLVLLWASVFHDLGKYETKSFYNFKGEKRETASFIGHEYVSAQLAHHYLTKYKFDESLRDDIVTLVQFHMYPMKASEKKMKQVCRLIGDRLYYLLGILHKADTLAK